MRALFKNLAKRLELIVPAGAVLWAFLRGLPVLLFLGVLLLVVLCAAHEWIPWRYRMWQSNAGDQDREFIRRVLVVSHVIFTVLVVAIPILAISGYEFVSHLPAWTEDRIVQTVGDKHLTENLHRDTFYQPIPTCRYKGAHLGLVAVNMASVFFPAEPVFEILLRPYAAVPGGVASIFSILLLVALWVLWMAEVLADVSLAAQGS